ncbi:MAG: glycerol-3-phosphate 1-O-acyltransferase PlsY, partial [Bacteroidetes bacterium]|nr:glycerol-3-phosphate 1-O-acyltransferase PlsY [Bacteroidota bacterium]
MEFVWIILGIIISYLIGSMPTALWVGKAFYGVDIREHGSGNSGATNTFRVLGKKAGIAVLLIDIIKGLTAASLVRYLNFVELGTVRFVNLQLLFGLSSVLGHIFPIYCGFKGGKGIATLLGMVIGIHYLSALACIGLFVVILFSTRYVSLSSILAAVAFPVIATIIYKNEEPFFIAFGIAAAIMVVLTHQKNIVRLVAGNENKAKLLKRHRR